MSNVQAVRDRINDTLIGALEKGTCNYAALLPWIRQHVTPLRK